MTYGGRAPLWARLVACVVVCLLVGTALALMAALAVWAVRLLAGELAWLTSLAWVGGVAQ